MLITAVGQTLMREFKPPPGVASSGKLPLQERAHAVDGAGLQLRRLLPGKHSNLGIWRQRGDVD
jgi:hypothetical protein